MKYLKDVPLENSVPIQAEAVILLPNGEERRVLFKNITAGDLNLGLAQVATTGNYAHLSNKLSNSSLNALIADNPGNSRGALQLGNSSMLNVGQGANTVAAGDDPRLVGSPGYGLRYDYIGTSGTIFGGDLKIETVPGQTTVSMSTLTKDSAFVESYLMSWNSISNSSVKGTLFLQSRDNLNRFQVYSVDEVFNQLTYVEINVTLINATNFLDPNEEIDVVFIPSGNVAEFSLPIGFMFYSFSSTTPVNYLHANGSTVLVSVYDELADKIYCGDGDNNTADWGYRCNNSNGSSRNTEGDYIVLPDARNRYVRGFGTGFNLWSYYTDDFKSHDHGATSSGTSNRVTTGGSGADFRSFEYENVIGAAWSTDRDIRSTFEGGSETMPKSLIARPIIYAGK